MNYKERLTFTSDQVKEILLRPCIRLGVPKKIAEAWELVKGEYIPELPELEKDDRRLLFGFGSQGQVYRLRQRDITNTLAVSQLDIGILGLDEYAEAILKGLPVQRISEVLSFGECKFGLGVKAGESLETDTLRAKLVGSGRIATSYPNLARCLH